MSPDPVLPVPLLVPAGLALVCWAAALALRARRRGRGAALAGLRTLAVLALAAGLLGLHTLEASGPAGGAAAVPRGPAAFVLAERAGPGLPAGVRERLAGAQRAGLSVTCEFGGPGAGDARASMEGACARALVACGARPSAALLFLAGPAAMGRAAPLASRLALAGAPVSAIAPPGAAGAAIALGTLEVAPREPRAGEPLVAACDLRGGSAAGEEVRVRWLLDGRAVASRTAAAPGPGGTIGLEHALLVPTAGLHRVRVEAAHAETGRGRSGDATGAFFLARPGPRRALVVEGAPRAAYRALQRSLAADAGLALSGSCAAERPPRARLLPREESDWAGLDLVVLGDLAAADFAPGALERLARFVRGGGGLVVVAGGRNLGAGGWGDTPLADILPVRVGRGDGGVRGPLDARPAGRVGEPRPFPFGTGLDPFGALETSGGARAEARSRAASWRELPEIRRAVSVAGLAPGASAPVVAVRPGLESPLLVHGRAGRGRVVIVLSDDLARWAAAGGGFRVAHDEFWRDVAAGAARASPDGGPRVWLEPAGGAAVAGRACRFTAFLADVSADALVATVHEGAGGGRAEESLPLAERGLVRTFEIVPPAEGTLRLAVRAVAGGRTLRSAPLEVRVFPSGDPESARPPRRPAGASMTGALETDSRATEALMTERLRAACRLSGGRLSTTDDPAPAVEAFLALAGGPSGAGPAPERRRDLLPPVAWVAAFVALLAGEWALRRAWGME